MNWEALSGLRSRLGGGSLGRWSPFLSRCTGGVGSFFLSSLFWAYTAGVAAGIAPSVQVPNSEMILAKTTFFMTASFLITATVCDHRGAPAECRRYPVCHALSFRRQ